MANENWEPKSRDDYVGMFADALGLDRQRRTEADEKAKADAAKNQPPAPEPPPATRTIQEKLLGIKRSPPAS